MLMYALVWAIPAFASLTPVTATRRLTTALFVAAAILLTLFIGLRDEIGGDWYNYLDIHRQIIEAPGASYLALTDPAFAVINRLFADEIDGIYFVNLVCAALFVAGTMRLCLDQPHPALALAIALAYLGIVVAMGYTRQSAAVGLIMWGLVSLQRRRVFSYTLAVIAAAMFHRAALVGLPFAFAPAGVRLRWQLAMLVVVALGLFMVVFFDAVQSQWGLYSSGDIQSDGGTIRVMMDVIPAAIYLASRREQAARWPDGAAVWTWMSTLALLLVPLLLVSSTVADRIGLYLVPLQIVVLARLPLIVGARWRAAVYLGVLALYGTTLGIWLNTSFFAQCCWIPYKSVL